MAAATYPHLELQRQVCLDLLGWPVGQRLRVGGCVPDGKALPLAQVVRPVVDLQGVAEQVSAALADKISMIGESILLSLQLQQFSPLGSYHT